jgi:uncharacterized protein involved in type VI secretion and phage assembly
MPVVTYVSEPILEIDGVKASPELLQDILQIAVEESLHLPGMFTLIIENSYIPGRSEDRAWKHENSFQIGKSIKIGFGSGTTEDEKFKKQEKDSILEGEITAIESHFSATSQAPIIIRGYDISHRLHRGRYNRSFQNKTDADIVKKIAGEVGISTGTIDETGGPYGYGDIGGSNGYIFQENQTNMEFLRERAARHGFELFIQDGKLNFRKPNVAEKLQLKWLENLHSFRIRISSSEQVQQVEVRGWDYSKKRPLTTTANQGKVNTKTEFGQGNQTSTAFKGKPPTPKLIVVDQPVFDTAEAQKIAQSLSDEIEGEFVEAEAIAEGNPKIRPGTVISITDMGKYSGEYYITETRHLYQERIYTTEFTVKGLRGGDLLTLLSPHSHLQPGQTLMVGIVTNNQDPKGWGRVRVKLPTLTEEHESYWARIVAIGAGPQRGFDCLPEINDEVLVAFEHGDIHRPYIIGNVWNGQDPPPEKVADSVVDGKVRLRTFKTRTGHRLQFIEEDKGTVKKGIDLDSVYGHQIHLNDTERNIDIKTKEGHQILLDDQNRKITIKTKGGHTCIMDDTTQKISLSSTATIEITAPQKITISVGGSTIELMPANINIKSTIINVEATTSLNLKGTVSANLEGTTTSVKGTAIAQVQGALVKIN